MTMNPLPPQAYTKDTLLKAYQWLMGQNSSIKEMASDPDTLVSLYLKATRDGDAALDRPSIQNFKNELKGLAGMMGELDRPNSKMAPQHVMPIPQAANPNIEVSVSKEPLDTATRAMIREVKEELNLSSDVEAMRMLIKIGYKRSKGLLG